MLSQWVYQVFGENAAQWVSEFAFHGTWQNTLLRILMVAIPLLIRVGLLVLVVILLVKGIKYLNKKNKE